MIRHVLLVSLVADPPHHHTESFRERIEFHENGSELMKNHHRISLPWPAIWGVFLAFVVFFLTTSAAKAAVPVDTRIATGQYIFNTFFLLICGALIMWMCAGFTMLESGSVRTKNASVICLKNIGLYAIAGIMFYLIGYNLMFVDVAGWIGSVKLLFRPSADEFAILAGSEKASKAVLESGYASVAFWFFQMTFVATTASIVSGALAERVKLWSFLHLHRRLDRRRLPVGGRLDVGRGLAHHARLQRLRRFHHRPLDRGMGGARGRHRGGRAARQVPPRRQRQIHAALQRPAGDSRVSSSCGSAGSGSTAARCSCSRARPTR